MREQNELLEFRLLELEEAPTRRDSPDHAMDSGIVSPEPAHANKVSFGELRYRVIRAPLCISFLLVLLFESRQIKIAYVKVA